MMLDDTLVCVERRCVAIRHHWDCTGEHGGGCPKGARYCAIEDAHGKKVARGRTWEVALERLRKAWRPR